MARDTWQLLIIDALYIAINDPNKLRVSIKQGQIVEIEAVIPKKFHSGERFEQIGTPPSHAMRVSCNKEFEKTRKQLAPRTWIRRPSFAIGRISTSKVTRLEL